MTHAPAPTPQHATPSIAIVGLGPRGVSLVERLGAHLSAAPLDARQGIELHLIDDAQAGAGRIWRTDQERELCMNTLAHAVTLFTEPGSSVRGPVQQGPTLYEWAILVRDAGLSPQASAHTAAVEPIPASHTATFATHPVRPCLADDYRAELASLRPESHPSRALYGEYLVWCFERAITALPSPVTVIRHRARAEQIERVGGRELITLSSGPSIAADSVILATGWLPRASTAAERTLEAALANRPELNWVRQGSPVDQDLSEVAAGAPAIVRGLGMGFFDTMALLTLGRGGSFAPDPSAPGGLRYAPSGREPILHVTSHRGVPFRAKSLYRSLPPRAEQTLLREVDWESVPRPINFDQLLWPRIVADAFIAHASTLRESSPTALGADPAAAGATLGAIVAAARAAISPILDGTVPAALDEPVSRVAAVVAPFIADPADRFDLAGEIHPVTEAFRDPTSFDAWISARVEADLDASAQGRTNAVKAGLWSISSARALTGRIGTLGGFDAESRASGYAQLHAVGGMVGSGPPAFRASQLLALADAGLVHFIGPEAEVTVTERGFVAASPLVAGSEVTATTLIDAWMHFHRINESTDPLTRSLLSAGRARPFRITARGADIPIVATGGFDIDGATGLLVGAEGTLDAAVHVAGIPVDETLHDTIISPMPGTDPPMLRETDRVALSALRIARAAAHQGGPVLTRTGAHHD
ncbi:FAD-NAD(P)-binding protein [Leucobacter luti]|uniref:FAD/NAD(P)-binding protein n=1 Tax=Leucobacter luti TaxID=340320 RepID=UPI001042E52C|nr:FAD/NAD(P)-binding protein [Leucobacter luti]MCW2289617.1 hypothetical protein [Leucobacter luti]TCK37789.1 FAD-NAD(P)-binding protein [Leucobacter luti]